MVFYQTKPKLNFICSFDLICLILGNFYVTSLTGMGFHSTDKRNNYPVDQLQIVFVFSFYNGNV